jgi:GT2 family glycosyltransferase
MKYVAGASTLVSRSFWEQIGLINQQYFLSLGEIDWAASANGKFSISHCPGSIVYDNEGSTSESTEVTQKWSSLTEFYATQSRVFFTQIHYPEALGTVCAALALSSFHRLLQGHWRNYCTLLPRCAQVLSSKNASTSRADGHLNAS